MPADTAYRTCGRFNAESSLRTEALPLAGECGTNAKIISAVAIVMARTTQYALRQPRCWPSTVLAGTPTTVATDRPSMTELTARPLNSGRTSEAASSEATPK